MGELSGRVVTPGAVPCLASVAVVGVGAVMVYRLAQSPPVQSAVMPPPSPVEPEPPKPAEIPATPED
jgi:hypothetical protein